jgi:hypothetical protein
MSRKRKRNAMLAVAAAAVAIGAIVAGVTAGGNGHLGGHSARAHDQPAQVGASGEVAAAAGYLGVTPRRLRRELRSGRTLAQIAAASGKSAAGLVDALVSARAKQLNAAVDAGKLSPSTEKTRLESLRSRITNRVDKTPGYIGLPAAARYLGVSTTRLRAQLHSGRSLAQIAGATPGKSAAALIGATVRAREAELKAARASGKITQATESALLATLRQRVTSEVDRTPSP